MKNSLTNHVWIRIKVGIDCFFWMFLQVTALDIEIASPLKIKYKFRFRRAFDMQFFLGAL